MHHEDEIEYTFHTAGNGETHTGPLAPMLPAWQYRIGYDEDLPQGCSPEAKCVWTYPPYSDEGEVEIMTDEEIDRHDIRLGEWNRKLARYTQDSCNNHRGNTLFLLYAYDIVEPKGIDAPYCKTISHTDRILVNNGHFECHVAYDSDVSKSNYESEADECWAELTDKLSDVDLTPTKLTHKQLAGLLCMLESRRIFAELNGGELTVDQMRNISDYANIEHTLFRDKLCQVDEQVWQYVKGIYAARVPLALFN